MADDRILSIAEKAEKRRAEQKQEQARAEAAAALTRLREVVAEWRKLIGQSILMEGGNGQPVEVVVKRVSDNGYVCVHVTGNTPENNPGIWVALAEMKLLDQIVTGTPLGLSEFAQAPAAPAAEAQKPRARRAPREKGLTTAPIAE